MSLKYIADDFRGKLCKIIITKRPNTKLYGKKLQLDHIKLANYYTKRHSSIIVFDIDGKYFDVHEAMKQILVNQIYSFDIIGKTSNNMSKFISEYATVHWFDADYSLIDDIVDCKFTPNKTLLSLSSHTRQKIIEDGIDDSQL